ncbi:hypothetical protein N0V82_003168 [Gnomoniopsis sp. IMI 355080]|nr:hypothetical protein N0V82_003168 [Gnomoniopsis sp. IMI 355080]
MASAVPYITGCHNQASLNTELATPKDVGAQDPLLASPAPNAYSMSEQQDAEEWDSTTSAFPSTDYLAQLPRPELGSEPYGQIITSCTVPGTLALTFDDGPWSYTSDLLDLLKRKGVRATFFVCGSNMAEGQLTGYGHPELLRRMVTSGHQIGSHTWAHANPAALSRSDMSRQMYLNEQALVGVLGILPTYFRPPYIEWSAQTLDVMVELGYHVVTLDVDTRDWVGDYDAAKQNYLGALGWGSDSKLVLAHDIHERTVYEFAEWMIDTAEERGYRLVTVGECLGDSVDNWYRSPYTGESWQSDKSSHAAEKRVAHPGDGYIPPTLSDKGPWAPEDYRRPDASVALSLRVHHYFIGLLTVLPVVFMFL